MKKNLLPFTAAFGITAALTITSCTYDPAYTRVSGSYSTGYGYGHGYGGSGFNTALFVSTGNPRWAYDPYTYCYYDYRTRRYYDPYLLGYYPVGYRPPVLIGVPHPHGWRPGRGYCPPPKVVRNVTVVNYRNRESAYRKTNHNWSRNVRKQDYSRSQQQVRNHQTRQNAAPESTRNRGWLNPAPRNESQERVRGSQRGGNPQSSPSGRPGSRDAGIPSRYNTPVRRDEQTTSRDNRRAQQANPGFSRPETRQQPRATAGQPNIRSAPREAPATRSQNTVRRPDMATRGTSPDPRRSGALRERAISPQTQAQPRPQSRPQPQQAQPRPQSRPQPQAQPQPAPRQAPPASRESRPSRDSNDPGRGNRENRRGLRSLGEA